MRLKPIDQQVVVLVGCTSGIGLETAKRLARLGAKQVLVGRGQMDLQRTMDEVIQEGGEAVIFETDVADWQGLQNAAQRAVDTYGRIDTWAHVASASMWAKMEDTEPEEFRRIIETDLNGPAFGILAALPHIKREGRGAIIIVSSVEAKIPVPYHGAYNAAKHGLDGMIDTLRIELRHDDIPISITNVMPATINTPFFMKAKTRTGFEPGVMPPVYDAASVADSIIYAAQHRVRSVSVGSASIIYQINQRISPRMNERMIQAAAFKAQETDIPKGADAPNNLYQHLEGYHQVEGKYPSKYSWTTWMQLHPVPTLLVGGLLLLALPVGITLLVRNRKQAGRKSNFNLGDIAVIGAVTGLVSNLLPKRRQKSLPQKVASRAKDMAPKAMFWRKEQTMPEKLMSKVQDILPSAIFPRQKSFTEKAVDRVKDIVPKRSTMQEEKRITQKAAQREKMIAEKAVRREKKVAAKASQREQRIAEQAYQRGKREAEKAAIRSQKVMAESSQDGHRPVTEEVKTSIRG